MPIATCRSAERRDGLAERLLSFDKQVRALVWIATTNEAIAGPFDAIWITSHSYKLATGRKLLEQ
jgi:hypothetical protein